MDISSNYLYSFSQHIKQRGQTTETFVSQQWLQQQEMETIKVGHHFTQEPKRPADPSNTLLPLLFAFLLLFVGFLPSSLLLCPVYAADGKSEQMRFAPSVSWNVPVTHAQIKTVPGSPTVCLQGCQHFTSMNAQP